MKMASPRLRRGHFHVFIAFQCGVGTVFFQELLTGTLFDDMLFIDHGNAVGIAYRRKPVRDDNTGFPLAQEIEAALDFLLRYAVEGGGRLIQDENGRILQKDPGDGNTLFLPAGEHHAALTDKAFISIRHVHDILMDFRANRGFHNFPVACTRPAVTDVIHNRAGEQENVLLDDSDILTQTLLRDGPDIPAVHQDSSGAYIVEARNQVTDGGLSPAGGTDQSKGLPRRNGQIDVLENRDVSHVCKAYMVKANFTADVTERHSVRRILNLRLGAHQFDKAGEPCAALCINLHELDEFPHRREEGRHIEREGEQIYKVHFTLHDQVTADSNDCHLHDADRGFDAGIEKAHRLVIADLALLEGLIGSIEFGILRAFGRKGFGGANAGDAALNGGIDFTGPDLDIPVRVLHTHALVDGKDNAEREKNDQDERKPGIDHEQNDESAKQRRAAGQNVLRPVVCQLDDFEQITGDTCHQHTGSVPIKEREGQRLHVGEDIAAHVCLNEGTHAMPDDRDQILKKGAQKIGDEKRRHNEKEGAKVLLRQGRIHGPACYIRKSKINQCNGERETHIQSECRAVRIDIGGKNTEL